MNHRIVLGAATLALALLFGCKTTPEASPVVTECNFQSSRCVNGQIQRCNVEGKWETFNCEAGTTCTDDGGNSKAGCKPTPPS